MLKAQNFTELNSGAWPNNPHTDSVVIVGDFADGLRNFDLRDFVFLPSPFLTLVGIKKGLMNIENIPLFAYSQSFF